MEANRANARRHLDARLGLLRGLVAQPRPPRGWVRAIRESLGMSTTEMAARMSVGQSWISALEKGEVAGTVKLGTLQRAAEALDCELVYALVPRTTLEGAVRGQAMRKAATRLKPIGHHMRLEDQTVGEADADAQLDELALRLIDRRGLWADG